MKREVESLSAAGIGGASAPALAQLRSGGKRAMAGALSLAERCFGAAAVTRLLDEAYENPVGHTTGITGPPGVGKSTLIDSLIRHWRARGLTVGVIAVDPSSRLTGGALLGDRIRMRAGPDDEGVFIRSLASRGHLGGLSEFTYAAVALMRAVYERVLVESVGVGQSEASISGVADTVVLCVQPGSGDALQFMKAGITEIPHIAVVTKSDTGALASRALADVKGALGLYAEKANAWEVRCLKVSAAKGAGLDELAAAIEGHYAWLTGRNLLREKRHAQAQAWLHSAIEARFGREGCVAASDHLVLKLGEGPFRLEADVARRLSISYRE